jgi:mannose-1-phosphate guanylyltransferase/mannose-6-phosphate isomerase
MSIPKLIPVLLAGGTGSRLWPLSREHYPKQLLSLFGKDSLLQATARRLVTGLDIAQLMVICNEEHRFEVLSQLEELNLGCSFKILLEPTGKNTAPAAALAALVTEEDAVFLFMPADHVLQPQQKFIEAVQLAQQAAQLEQLITFGVKPTYPETGYGYIKIGAVITKGVYAIEQFVEKPTKDVAEQFIVEGNYYWNSGMFCFPKALFLQELAVSSPTIYQTSLAAAQTIKHDGHFLRVNPDLFNKIPTESLDYALMEHTQKAAMISLDLQWSDIGSWQALYEYEKKDAAGNVQIGDVVGLDNKNCYLRSESKLLAVIGLEDVIAVQTGDCVLLANRQQSQKVKELVQQLQKDQREEAVRHLTEYHPWGMTTLLNKEETFIINRVDVEPKARLSLHEHQLRSEHWIVLEGYASVSIDGQVHHYKQGDAFFIPAKAIHYIANETDELLRLVEVQAGKQISPQDIYRHEE